MPTLYVENVPENLYTALKERARNERSSVAAEVISILKQMVPTEAELARRKAFLKKALQLSAQRSPSPSAINRRQICFARIVSVERICA